MSGKNGRRREFEKTALPHLDRMYQFGLRLTRNRQEAEDLVQEAYLRAWRFFDSFKPGSNARAWLYRILYNVFLGQIKKKGRRREIRMPEETGMQDLLLYENMVRRGGWRDPIEMTPGKFNRLFGDEVQRALDRLPGSFRFPLMLCDVDGMTYAEIAKVMGCPVNTVRSRLSRARAFLERELEQYARKYGYFKIGREK